MQYEQQGHKAVMQLLLGHLLDCVFLSFNNTVVDVQLDADTFLSSFACEWPFSSADVILICGIELSHESLRRFDMLLLKNDIQSICMNSRLRLFGKCW